MTTAIKDYIWTDMKDARLTNLAIVVYNTHLM